MPSSTQILLSEMDEVGRLRKLIKEMRGKANALQAENERLRARVSALDKGLKMAVEWNWITPEGIPSVTVDFIDQLLSPTPNDDGEAG